MSISDTSRVLFSYSASSDYYISTEVLPSYLVSQAAITLAPSLPTSGLSSQLKKVLIYDLCIIFINRALNMKKPTIVLGVPTSDVIVDPLYN